jgi:hypothetical protein
MDTYMVEITETLQKQVTVEANSPDEAVELVEKSYRNSDNILDADNFVGVDFKIVSDMED